MAYYYSPFRKEYKKSDSPSAGACVFCDPEKLATQQIRDASDRPLENEHYLWLVNIYPKFEGHTLLVPKRHFASLEAETEEEALARHRLAITAAQALQTCYPGAGIEYFLQYGEGSESSVSHIHWHLVPAMPDDPFRSFEKLGHFYTTTPDEEKVIMFPTEIQRSPHELLDALRGIL